MWDAINEVVIMPVFDRYDNAVTRLCKEHGQQQALSPQTKTVTQKLKDSKECISGPATIPTEHSTWIKDLK